MKKTQFSLLVLIISSLACSLPGVGSTPTPIPPTATNTPAFTSTTEPTFTQTITLTPTITFTPTISATPTFAFPTAIVNKQAHCRYGPSVAYLHAADLYPGDIGSVRSRAFYSNWLYVKFDKLDYFCWVAPSIVDVVGDITTLNKVEPNLLSIGSNRFGPPGNVQAVRDDNKVIITWDQVEMDSDDRGYFIEAFVCQDGAYLWWTQDLKDQYETSYTVKDEAGCNAPSYGNLYTVEKHGYSKPVEIPWPTP